jgi:hypothetical protein
MTEAEWLASGNFRSLLRGFYDKTVSDRKLRLFSCACCSLVWHLLPDLCHRLVEEVERYAEKEAGRSNLEKMFEDYDPSQVAMSDLQGGDQAAEAIAHLRLQWRFSASEATYQVYRRTYSVSRSAAEALAKTVLWHHARQLQIELLRDIFGNPFRPIALNPSWLTSTVIALANGIYEEKAFDRMPILADALEDAGCDDAAILNHCREPNGVHTRGCWVVDLLTDRK